MVKWIMGYVRSSSSIVLINGFGFDLFRPTRWLREGFPLYPLFSFTWLWKGSLGKYLMQQGKGRCMVLLWGRENN